MSRIQLALRVPDLQSAIAFYSKLLDTEPAKLRDGYANFAVTEPPLKLVLIEEKRARTPAWTTSVSRWHPPRTSRQPPPG